MGLPLQARATDAGFSSLLYPESAKSVQGGGELEPSEPREVAPPMCVESVQAVFFERLFHGVEDRWDRPILAGHPVCDPGQRPPDRARLAPVGELLDRDERKLMRRRFKRMRAKLMKATVFPSSEMAGAALSPLASIPPVAILTRVVVRLCVSNTKTSLLLLLSSATRLVAELA
ncbi:MAG: hypothetical protein IIB12_08960 [Chloroflexi bacterium]|nr:hypothetical protein [Chloroflexota bacterium]